LLPFQFPSSFPYQPETQLQKGKAKERKIKERKKKQSKLAKHFSSRSFFSSLSNLNHSDTRNQVQKHLPFSLLLLILSFESLF